MRIDIRAGEQVTIGRSRDGKILIVQRESGTMLITTSDDRVAVEVSDIDGSLWKSPMTTDYDYEARFWERHEIFL